MTEYRVGQRVRVVDVQEGPVTRVERGFIYVDGVPRVTDGSHDPKMTRTITILSEPIPDEPKGIGAVVVDIRGGLWVRTYRGDRKPWREVLPGTYDEDDACRRPWEHIDTPQRVLSEGIAQ